MQIIVGSKNPAKIQAVQVAIDKIYPGEKIFGVEVGSGVSDQPTTESEALKGAINRAKAVQEKTGADFGIGIEGGVYKVGNRWFGGSFMAIYSKDKRLGLGTSLRFELSRKISDKILTGKEMAEVIDELSGKTDVRSNEGAMGILTAGHLTRSEAYSQGVIFAFAPFLSDKKFWK